MAKAWSDAQDVAGFALGLIGVNYKWGGDTPARGLDCSGLIRYVFQEVTGVTLPRTAKELSRIGESVSLSDLSRRRPRVFQHAAFRLLRTSASTSATTGSSTRRRVAAKSK